tara:strand:+ start:2588 stop:3556 length:969 start_codon:yes stop_codon:yes gene_type:complete
MSFFNKKEDVLDFQLTEYGKRLLEQGLLKPSYYAFFDDEVLYDSEAGGFSESQNSTARRIKYETPALKAQANTTGVESRVNEFLLNVTGGANEDIFATTISENSVDFVNAFQSTPHFGQKYFLGSDPLGNSDLKTEYAPAWHINCLAAEISSSQEYLTVNLTGTNAGLADGIVRQIPQLDITLDYKTFLDRSTFLEENSVENVVQLTSDHFDGNVELYVQENFLVLDVQEKNTEFMKENVSIEVFEVASDNTLMPLGFMRPEGLLETPGDNKVEYYMNILADGDIPAHIAEELGISMASIRGESVRVHLSRDLYQTDNEEPC